jgi:transcription initiation factor TFIIIB Brf1 subunit/transcription initiation factor TFIIB
MHDEVHCPDCASTDIDIDPDGDGFACQECGAILDVAEVLEALA